LRLCQARPIRPEPRSRSEPGSGTAIWQKDCCFVNFADGESFCSEEKIKKNILMRLKLPPYFRLKQNMIRWGGKIDLDVQSRYGN
jgi:hypothetical protein